ncbi:MAG: zinc ribbon domain-containing protein [Nevskiales bacterium]|nr:zinc ribbon domain-containing protein [Nevskiales bacterium]
MPLYDYRCPRCQEVFELLVSASTKPRCPHCGGRKLERLMSAPAAPGRSAQIIKQARRRAAQEGHFSHYAPHERPRR